MKQVYLLLLLVIGLLAVLVLFPSCNTERRALKKYVKTQKKYPEWFVRDTVHIDTVLHVRHVDTIYIDKDSIEDIVPVRDTTIYSDKLTIQFWKDQYNGLMRYKTTLNPDTIYIDSIVQVPVYLKKLCPERLTDQAIVKNYLRNLIPWWIYALAALLFSMFIYSFFKRK